ncbi:uncharacterized protein MELLADRAFT_101954 [Melampsora larici-populina 98AG31]|uniref:F-box domain-containing protein n=1 Tax=Melampsora larici-populina (strain 98AG31 / pathotype 3-4-7) TaxID=747676 RepID=F4R5H2_MELLP|nr:uncharacterized protein MELLADRAFT_101954 [Melampsora larici-populina 98AG31]EGG12046.1 hypothetical protein MELLADRAFT_101954 [Melampsora larici-populina 98AG31]
MPPTTSLPIEIIQLIIFHFCDKAAYIQDDEYNSAEVKFLTQVSVRRSIRILEFMPPYYVENSKAMILALRYSLEALFIDRFPDHIPPDLRMSALPKLQLVRNTYMDGILNYPGWCEWTLFENVEIFITSYNRNSYFWAKILKEDKQFHLPPKLKHFVFIIEEGGTFEDDGLFPILKDQDIECHFRNKMDCYDILELIDKLGSKGPDREGAKHAIEDSLKDEYVV